MTSTELHEIPRKQLAQLARQYDVRGWHAMRKAELVDALAGVLPEHRQSYPPSKQRRTGRGVCRLPANDLEAGPAQHEDDVLTAFATDPHWVFARWVLSTAMLQRAEAALKSDWHAAVPVLRVFEMSDEESRSPSRAWTTDVEISQPLDCWHVPVPHAGRAYRLQLGYRTPAGRFFTLAKSQRVNTPTSRGPHRAANDSAPPEAVADFSSRNRSRRSHYESDALAITAEVILHGQSSPRARVVLNGVSIEAGDDGRFSIRFALDEGRQIITGACRDHILGEERTVVIGLERNTRFLEPQPLDEFPASVKIGA